MNTAQLMLLQYNGRTIYLLPAWPPAWDCQFKLHAPANTIVEGEVSGGKVTRLEVTPESRRKERRGLPAVHRPLTPVTRFSVSCEVRLPGSCSQRARLRRPVSFQDVQRSLETPQGGFSFGLGAYARLRDRAVNEASVNPLIPTVWKARRIYRREHPDARRATITEAAPCCPFLPFARAYFSRPSSNSAR